ncbi:Acetyltransferase (GNAT) family protein [Orenia metallireducens]|uniref:Acetyltransferase (GNAT) family protein n=1 Tax=Orenia metallireducens TaxID=1413210 RepID=A0A285GFC2_9FIRM|nr:GNAT family N-acetyltransferase [Orenia metallireducens]SNY22118.1 Acetyltransferase (GNAT) family protein [Orenia metallireducens]
MEIFIKKAELADSQLVYNLTKAAFKAYDDPSLFPTTPALLESKDDIIKDIKDKEILIAYLDNNAVGTVRYYGQGEDFYLIRLGVLPEYQGYEIGKKLILEVEERVRAEGGRRIILYSPSRLMNLINFYKDLDYQVIEIREDEDYTRAKLAKIIDS